MAKRIKGGIKRRQIQPVISSLTKIMASGPITSWEIDGETVEAVSDFISGAPKSLQMVIAAVKLKDATPWKKSYDQPR